MIETESLSRNEFQLWAPTVVSKIDDMKSTMMAEFTAVKNKQDRTNGRVNIAEQTLAIISSLKFDERLDTLEHDALLKSQAPDTAKICDRLTVLENEALVRKQSFRTYYPGWFSFALVVMGAAASVGVRELLVWLF